MFDQVFSKIYELLQYQINDIRIIMKYTTILYIFGIANITIFSIHLVNVYKI
jgi:hypothetical protein